MKKILIIDDDIAICKQIKYNLLNTDTEAYYTNSIKEALKRLQIEQYSLVIMDVLLSTVAGIEILGAVRRLNDSPLFVLSEQASSTERVLALKCGADDVLAKPYDLEECLARAHALMRRDAIANGIAGRSYVIVGGNDLMLDTLRRRVSIAGRDVSLTRKEYDILLYLLTHRKQVLTYEQIYDAVWKDAFLGDKSAVTYHVHKLHKKLGGYWIESVYGVGYRVRDPLSKDILF